MNIAELRRLEAEARPRDLVLILRTEAQNQRTPPIDYVIAEDGGRMVHRPEPDIAMAELLEEAACALAEKDKELAALRRAGAPLATIAFNLAQGGNLPPETCAILNEAREDWDEVARNAGGKDGE